MIDSVTIARAIDDVQRFLSKADQGDKLYVPMEEVREYIENLEEKLKRTESWAEGLEARLITLERDSDDQDNTIARLEDRIEKAKDVLAGHLER